MIFWSFISFAIALVAGLFGFGGSASAAAGVFQTVFFVFFALSVVLFAVKLARDHEAGRFTDAE